jgi:hypothetical protein
MFSPKQSIMQKEKEQLTQCYLCVALKLSQDR